MSTSQVDRLGERLRGAEILSEEDLALLQRFRAEHEAALLEVQARLERAIPGVAQAARIKTIQTLHDKLRRQPTKLSRIQDIAGVRIVEEMDLPTQDAMVTAIQREFPGSRVVDRRVYPTFGYRAVHVIVRIGRCACEVQVRTIPQHLWAEIVERLADLWGRDIRYGGEPDLPETPVGEITRKDLWELIRGVSDQMHALEEAAADQNFAVGSGEAPPGLQLVDLEQARRDTREVLARLRDFLASGATL
ncbi:MAG TPA: RelA/SpoT domain-containing protein [Gemmatimonadota bacterium]|nr:RelA/SpoT domain-containing protein [Gemmatimonadota bacterium]